MILHTIILLADAIASTSSAPVHSNVERNHAPHSEMASPRGSSSLNLLDQLRLRPSPSSSMPISHTGTSPAQEYRASASEAKTSLPKKPENMDPQVIAERAKKREGNRVRQRQLRERKKLGLSPPPRGRPMKVYAPNDPWKKYKEGRQVYDHGRRQARRGKGLQLGFNDFDSSRQSSSAALGGGSTSTSHNDESPALEASSSHDPSLSSPSSYQKRPSYVIPRSMLDPEKLAHVRASNNSYERRNRENGKLQLQLAPPVPSKGPDPQKKRKRVYQSRADMPPDKLAHIRQRQELLKRRKRAAEKGIPVPGLEARVDPQEDQSKLPRELQFTLGRG
jgi:hypothetical protein